MHDVPARHLCSGGIKRFRHSTRHVDHSRRGGATSTGKASGDCPGWQHCCGKVDMQAVQQYSSLHVVMTAGNEIVVLHDDVIAAARSA